MSFLPLKLVPFDYTHFIHQPREDNFGLALYSKHPIANTAISSFGLAQIPTIQTDIHLPENSLNLIGTHPQPPVSKVNSDARNQQLLNIAGHILEKPHDYRIVTGDLNCTPWSFIFKDFVSQTSLYDSSIDNGIGGTWFKKLGVISIPIDHVLGSAGIIFTKKEIKGTYGSDHNAVLVTFKFLSEEI